MLIPLRLPIFIAAMCLVVALSNILVEIPIQITISGINLADSLTWGALTYPMAFLVTDLANRTYGTKDAKKIVLAGFILAVLLSVILASPRIAVASGSAFLIAQLLDINIFDKLRNSTWWRAPLISSVLGSLVDTAIFFTLAFASAFVILGPNFDVAIESSPLLGIFQNEAPRWVSWAIGDFTVKMLVGVSMLLPYRIATKLLPKTETA